MDNSTTPSTIAVTALTVQQLQDMGINLPDTEMQALLAHAQGKVDDLVSEEFFESLSNEQVDELIDLQKKNPPADEIEQWLGKHIPDYREIIEDNTAIVLGELAENADQIQGAA